MSLYKTPIKIDVDLYFKEAFLKLLHDTTRISMPVYYQSTTIGGHTIDFTAFYHVNGNGMYHILLSNDERRRLLREHKK